MFPFKLCKKKKLWFSWCANRTFIYLNLSIWIKEKIAFDCLLFNWSCLWHVMWRNFVFLLVFIATLHYTLWNCSWNCNLGFMSCHPSCNKSVFLSVLVLVTKPYYAFNDRLHFILDSGIWKSQLLVFQIHVCRGKVDFDQEQNTWLLLNKLELL